MKKYIIISGYQNHYPKDATIWESNVKSKDIF